MDDDFAIGVAVAIPFNDNSPVARFALLYDGGPIAIVIAIIMARTNRYASPTGPASTPTRTSSALAGIANPMVTIAAIINVRFIVLLRCGP